MKRLCITTGVMLFCLNLFLSTAFAADRTEERIDYSDGSYAIITTETGVLMRAVTDDSKTYTYYNADDVKCFSYTLYASFSYDGTTSSADYCDYSAGIYYRGWDMSSHNEYTSGNCAYGSAIFTGPSGEQRNASLYLRCDKNGNVT